MQTDNSIAVFVGRGLIGVFFICIFAKGGGAVFFLGKECRNCAFVKKRK